MKKRHKYYNEIIAFAEGRTIQSKRPDEPDTWQDDHYPLWNDPDIKFRIKEEPKYIPFTFEDRDELRGKWVRRKSTGVETIIYYIDKGHMNGCTWEQTLEKFEFLDGTPFGKLN